MKALGLKIKMNADGSKTGYWVASQCSRLSAGYPDRTRRLAGDPSTWEDQCRDYTDDLRAWITTHTVKPLCAKGGLTIVEQRMLTGKKSTAGFVYVLRDKDRVKIGYSTNPRNRIATIHNTSGVASRVVACVPGSKKAEQKLHVRFASLRTQGEWFRIDGDLREFLKQPARNLKKEIG